MIFFVLVNLIVYLGVIFVFVDSEKDIWNICLVFLDEVIMDWIVKGKKLKVIIVVYFYGMFYKVIEFKVIFKKYDIFIIEDSVEVFGSIYMG